MSTPFIVGAYAALEPGLSGVDATNDEACVYEALKERGYVTGIEFPFRSALHSDLDWLATQLRGGFDAHVITAIPGTMQRLAVDPHVGLGSLDADGREAALAFVRRIFHDARVLSDATGQAVLAVEVHSAPSFRSNPEALKRSLSQLQTERADSDPLLVIEHCDAAACPVPGEKNFLDIDAEIRVARETGAGITVNWGRSVLETRSRETAVEHLRAARGAGVLAGFMASGVGGSSTAYGPAWGDAHLPHSVDEPSSLLDDHALGECLEAAGSSLAYAGVKIQTPRGLDPRTRIEAIDRIARPMLAAM